MARREISRISFENGMFDGADFMNDWSWVAFNGNILLTQQIVSALLEGSVCINDFQDEI